MKKKEGAPSAVDDGGRVRLSTVSLALIAAVVVVAVVVVMCEESGRDGQERASSLAQVRRTTGGPPQVRDIRGTNVKSSPGKAARAGARRQVGGWEQQREDGTGGERGQSASGGIRNLARTSVCNLSLLMCQARVKTKTRLGLWLGVQGTRGCCCTTGPCFNLRRGHSYGDGRGWSGWLACARRMAAVPLFLQRWEPGDPQARTRMGKVLRAWLPAAGLSLGGRACSSMPFPSLLDIPQLLQQSKHVTY